MSARAATTRREKENKGGAAAPGEVKRKPSEPVKPVAAPARPAIPVELSLAPAGALLVLEFALCKVSAELDSFVAACRPMDDHPVLEAVSLQALLEAIVAPEQLPPTSDALQTLICTNAAKLDLFKGRRDANFKGRRSYQTPGASTMTIDFRGTVNRTEPGKIVRCRVFSGLALRGQQVDCQQLLADLQTLEYLGLLKVTVTRAAEILAQAFAAYTPVATIKARRSHERASEKRAKTAPMLRPGSTMHSSPPPPQSSAEHADRAGV